jgi:hypothetical protein
MTRIAKKPLILLILVGRVGPRPQGGVQELHREHRNDDDQMPVTAMISFARF